MINIQRGQSVKWLFTIKKADVPVDLTGGTWEVLEPTSKPIIEITLTDPENGQSMLTIDKDETKNLIPRKYVIRARFVFPDGTAIATSKIEYSVQ